MVNKYTDIEALLSHDTRSYREDGIRRLFIPNQMCGKNLIFLRIGGAVS